MNHMLRTGLLLAGLSGLAAQAAEPSLCLRLADEARRAPAATWMQRDPLSAWVRPAAPSQPTPVVTALASDARWRELLGASDGRAMDVQQLAGTSVYLVEDVAGTAHCQSLVLVDAALGRPSHQLKPPFDLDGMDLCMTQSARFARVMGRPVLLVGGAPAMASPDLQYRIAPWTGQGWGRSCSIQVRRHTAMALSQRFCAPGAQVCEAGQPVAQRLAQAYEASRAAGKPLDGRAFNGGAPPAAGVLATLNPPLSGPGDVGDFNLPLPLFGADDKRLDAMATTFSNADPRRLPVLVDGRWLLAVVGRGGVGWREGDAVLVTLFALPGRAADATASYQFRVGPTGLRDVVARDERP